MPLVRSPGWELGASTSQSKWTCLLRDRGWVRGDPFKCLLPYKSQVPLLIPKPLRPRLPFPKGIQSPNIAAHHPRGKLAAPIMEHGGMAGAAVGLVLARGSCGDVSGRSDSAVGNVPRMPQATFPLCHGLPGWPEPRLPVWGSGDPQHCLGCTTAPTLPTHSRHRPCEQPQCSPRWERASSPSTPVIPVHPPRTEPL